MTDVNKFRFKISNNQQYINLPIQVDFNHYGQDEDIDVFQEKTKEEIVGTPQDFDVNRYAHSGFTDSNGFLATSINYQFYFYDSVLFGTNPPSFSNAAAWKNSYVQTNIFSDRDLYYYTNPFTKSFFKLDLYDTPYERDQKIYMTIIIPTQQGNTEFISASSFSYAVVNFDVKKPDFVLDSVGADKEGYYLYWLRSNRIYDIDTFYMSIKFFNARTGQFVRMMKKGQFTLSGNYNNFKPEVYFYDKVVLDHKNQVYSVLDITTNARVDTTSPMKWYEYVNPQ